MELQTPRQRLPLACMEEPSGRQPKNESSQRVSDTRAEVVGAAESSLAQQTPSGKHSWTLKKKTALLSLSPHVPFIVAKSRCLVCDSNALQGDLGPPPLRAAA